MFDIGWTEIVTIVVLAVLIIGPKDLPKAMRGFAKMIGKAKAMMREFQSNIDEMIKDSELEEVKKQIQSARSFDIKSQISNAIDSDGEIQKGLDVSKEAADFNKSLKEPSKPEAQEEPAPALASTSSEADTGSKAKE